MLLSRSLSWENVRSRYSVSRTAVESSKFFVSSATDASFCAMATPCVYETLRDGEAPGRSIRCSRLGKTEELRRKRTELDSRSGMSFRTPAQAPVLTELRSVALSRTQMNGCLWFLSSCFSGILVTVSAFCAMATLCVYETLLGGAAPVRSIRCSRLGKTDELRRKRTELDSRSGMSFRTPAQAPVLTELRSGALSRTPMTGGLWLVFQHTPPPHLPPNPPPSPTETTCSRRTHTSSMPR